MSRHRVRVAPSLLAADSARLAEEVQRLEGMVDLFHVDVMDGHFVPNLAMGIDVVEALRDVTDAILDVHLMVDDPDRWLEPYRDAGADWISIHWEAATHVQGVLSRIRALGARAGLALNPHSMPRRLEYVLDDGDLLLVMSVNPGFGGQRFLAASLDKLQRLRRELDEAGRTGVEIEVDGGVDADNAAACVAAGADILVAGSSVYGTDDPPAAVRRIQRAVAANTGVARGSGATAEGEP